MSENMRRTPEGAWVPAEPIPHSGGLDWEVYGPERTGWWRGDLFDGDTHLTTIYARSKKLFITKVIWASAWMGTRRLVRQIKGW